MKLSFLLGSMGAAFVLAACSGSDGSPTESSNNDLKSVCVDNVLCIATDHWDPTLCKCVPNTIADSGADRFCADNVLCIQGTHWESTACQCVKDIDAGNRCVENVLCIQGKSWDRTQCRCVDDKEISGEEDAACAADERRVPSANAGQPTSHQGHGPGRPAAAQEGGVVPPSLPGEGGTASCVQASDCKGFLPQYCQICADGRDGCAHFTCRKGQCEIATCD